MKLFFLEMKFFSGGGSGGGRGMAVVVAAMAVAAVASVVRNGFPCQEKLFSMNLEKALQRTMNRNCVKSTFARSLACSLKPFTHLLC